jgi:hypothetical protein
VAAVFRILLEVAQVSGVAVVARARGSRDVMVIGTHKAKLRAPFHIELDPTCDVPHRYAEKGRAARNYHR